MHEALIRVLLIGGSFADYDRIGAALDAAGGGVQFQLLWQQAAVAPESAAGQHDVCLLAFHPQDPVALDILHALADIPVIALTADQDGCHGAIAVRGGAIDFLAREDIKPYLLERCILHALERHSAQRKLQSLNLYDPLTGIPNRLLFRKTLEQTLERARVQQVNIALLLINLDGFKKINESFGDDAGDQLVATMAQRLTRCVRKSDSVARIGADEFTVILDDCHTADDVGLVARKVIDVLAAPFVLDETPVMASCSIGIALFPESGATAESLLQHANLAMSDAKSRRGSQFSFFNANTRTEAINRTNLEADMRRAIRNHEFELYYQPRVVLESGETVGMEALIRWRHPQRGLVSPKEFIPVAEESGLIVPIGYWVIQQACADMLLFDAQNDQRLDIAVNLSFKQLQDGMFVDTARRIIEESGIDARRLEFELTETAIMSNYQQTYEGMIALSQLGITFSLDDFGTGFSSFAHIQRLPISALKIDRSFIRSVVKNEDDAVIVKAMINLAHSLRLRVIAEGVETLDQVQFLWQSHCDQVQGYYFSPAVSARDFSLLINQRATVNA